jgi:hypothetical protein
MKIPLWYTRQHLEIDHVVVHTTNGEDCLNVYHNEFQIATVELNVNIDDHFRHEQLRDVLVVSKNKKTVKITLRFKPFIRSKIVFVVAFCSISSSCFSSS